MILAYAILGLIIGLPLIIAGGVSGAIFGICCGYISLTRSRRRQRKSQQGAIR
jgi:hypothetical protein